MKKFLKRAFLPLAIAAAVVIPTTAATATGSFNCNGVWHTWTNCVTTSSSGHFTVSSFSYKGNPYFVYITVDSGGLTYTYQLGPINDVLTHGVNVHAGSTNYKFYNNSGTNYGTQLYHINVS